VNENISYDNPILGTSHFCQHFDVFIVFSYHIKRLDSRDNFLPLTTVPVYLIMANC